jgi:hypothetical protein
VAPNKAAGGAYAFGGLILIINRSLTRVILAPMSPNSVAILKNRPRRHQNRVQFSGVVLSPVIHRNGQGCGLFRWASYFSMVNQSAGRLLFKAFSGLFSRMTVAPDIR